MKMNHGSEQAYHDDDFEDDEEDALKNRYLSFSVGDEDYGIEIQYVTEIVGIQKISPVPDMPEFIKGVINLRGQVIPVMDVRLRFNLPWREYSERTCVIVIRLSGDDIGLVVDAVREVTEIKEDDISEPPKVAGNGNARFMSGIAKVAEDVKILLDVNKLLFESERLAISKQSTP